METPIRPGRGDASGATPKQRGYVRRLMGAYVRGVAWRGFPVFARGADAVCYALARHAPTPGSKREASIWIETLLAEDGGLIWLARRREYRDWRRRALLPLATRHDYPQPGWLDRLNAAVADARDRVPDLEPRQEYGYQKGVDANPTLFRSQVVDPLFLMPPAAEAGDGQDAP